MNFHRFINRFLKFVLSFCSSGDFVEITSLIRDFRQPSGIRIFKVVIYAWVRKDRIIYYLHLHETTIIKGDVGFEQAESQRIQCYGERGGGRIPPDCNQDPGTIRPHLDL